VQTKNKYRFFFLIGKRMIGILQNETLSFYRGSRKN
jgi:hypothetical protein